MSEIRTACAEGILRVDFNRPDKKNAITAAMYQSLADALVNAGTDRSVRVILFGSTSAIFTAGNDLGDFRSNPPRDGETPVAVGATGDAGGLYLWLDNLEGKVVFQHMEGNKIGRAHV